MTTDEEEMLNEEMKKEREWGNEGDREMEGQTLATERVRECGRLNLIERQTERLNQTGEEGAKCCKLDGDREREV